MLSPKERRGSTIKERFDRVSKFHKICGNANANANATCNTGLIPTLLAQRTKNRLRTTAAFLLRGEKTQITSALRLKSRQLPPIFNLIYDRFSVISNSNAMLPRTIYQIIIFSTSGDTERHDEQFPKLIKSISSSSMAPSIVSSLRNGASVRIKSFAGCSCVCTLLLLRLLMSILHNQYRYDSYKKTQLLKTSTSLAHRYYQHCPYYHTRVIAAPSQITAGGGSCFCTFRLSRLLEIKQEATRHDALVASSCHLRILNLSLERTKNSSFHSSEFVAHDLTSLKSKMNSFLGTSTCI